MTEIKEVKGDLFSIAPQVKDAVIIHGANCFSTMGAGVAAIIHNNFPSAFMVDKEDVRTPSAKFGSFSYYDFGGFIIANAYTQFHPGPNVSYSAIELALTQVRDAFAGRPFFMPKIGAGIAGGDWDRIKAIMSKVFENEDATVVIYE